MKKDLLIILISFLGLIASYYLLIHDIRLESGAEVNSICAINEFIDCDAVSLSVYSKIFGIAVASLGAGYYLSLLLLTTIRLLTASPVIKSFILSTTFILTAISVITSIFLGYISLFKISALCIFCFFTYFCNIFLFIISLILIKGIKMRQLFSNLFSANLSVFQERIFYLGIVCEDFQDHLFGKLELTNYIFYNKH